MGWLGVIRQFLRIAGPYWQSDERWRAIFLTVTLVALTAAQIGIPVAINVWILNLFDALESHAIDRFSYLIGFLLLIVMANVAIVNLHLRVKRRLQIGGREWLTHKISDEWMVGGKHLLTYLPGAHDNPDGRIAEDVHNGRPKTRRCSPPSTPRKPTAGTVDCRAMPSRATPRAGAPRRTWSRRATSPK